MKHTQDGFFLVYRSLSDLLAANGILDFPGSDGVRLACSRFFDDWFLYAVPDGEAYIYSLVKLREQEHDANDGAPADGDAPGVTISFVPFCCETLLDCLAEGSDENRKKLNMEINRVVAYRKQRHHHALKRYFMDPTSEGAYLVALLYTKHIAAFAQNGCLEVPEYYKEIVGRDGSSGRLPRFIEALNRKAGYVVCDNRNIFIRSRLQPNEYECAAILATHTGNTSWYSFAAEVEFHAKFLFPAAKIPIPFFGKSLYDSAIRADMTVCDPEFAGPAPFYRANSKLVRRQRHFHEKRLQNMANP